MELERRQLRTLVKMSPDWLTRLAAHDAAILIAQGFKASAYHKLIVALREDARTAAEVAK